MPFLRYSALRLLILLASLGLLWLLGMRGWWWLLMSVVIAAPISYLVLRPQRDAAVTTLAARSERAKAAASAPPAKGSDEDEEDTLLDGVDPDSTALTQAAGATPPEPKPEGDSDGELK